ncbi:hypothetical protein GX48_08406 [Paracoccidioides brasiliensis]|nr:hypothetical protein GX48_08406 [Paracoccidioides brasiliensis]
MCSAIPVVNPLAHAVISSCVQNTQSWKCVAHDPEIGFITEPLTDVFGHQPCYLDADEFYLLNARFQRIYGETDRTARFRTNLILSWGIRDMLPASLAGSITTEDLRCFQNAYALVLSDGPLVELTMCLYKQRHLYRVTVIVMDLKSYLKSVAYNETMISLELGRILELENYDGTPLDPAIGVVRQTGCLMQGSSFTKQPTDVPVISASLKHTMLPLLNTSSFPQLPSVSSPNPRSQDELYAGKKIRRPRARTTNLTHHVVVCFLPAPPLYEAPHCDAFDQVRTKMDVNVSIKSGDTLDLYRDSGRVLRSLIDDGWIVLKDATDTNSIELVVKNQDKPILMPASRLENSPFEHFPQGEKLAERKDEILGVTAYHLYGKDNKMQWRWQYCIGGSEGDQPKTIQVTGGYVIICSGWLLQQLPMPAGKTDLYLINYYQSDYSW